MKKRAAKKKVTATKKVKVDQSKIISAAALPDTRPASQRAKDHIALEVAAAAVVPFQNKKVTKISITEYNQWYVGSCVPHGICTQLEYEGIIQPSPKGLSQLRLYRKRANYPYAGSNGVDIYDKLKLGQSLNSEAPTAEQMTEAMATAMALVAGDKIIPEFKYFQYVDPQGNLNLADVPADVASGKAVAIFIYATEDEWSREYVTVRSPNLAPADAYVRHCICIIPQGDFTENGVQYFSVQDSAKFGGLGLRHISRDFFNKRVYFASKVYKTGDAPVPVPPAPAIPTKACKKGDQNAAVTTLQTYLSQRGFLEPQYISGYYGAVTSAAVLWWQLFNHEKFTDKIPQLLALKGENFGPQSLAVVKLIG